MASTARCPNCEIDLPAAGGPCRSCTVTRLGTDDPLLDYDGPERIASYTIVRELGAGGMGTVYLAHDEKMNRDVALKVLSRHHAPSEKAGRRFEQEAWIAGKLDHPNLVMVHERGTWEELSYYSMELVDGGSIHDVVQNMRRKGRDDEWGLEFGSSQYIHWAIRKVIEVARGLDFAHRQGVTHRDIKPMNLLLSRELGTVKITDFGLALDASLTRMTTAGRVMGTMTFMAPEQILGKREQIDSRTDIYALGVTLFEMLTLELPYSGKTEQMYMSQVLTTEARRASKINALVSRDLEIVLRKSMEKERKHRYQTMEAFAEDLENVLHLRPIQAKPSGWIKRSTKWVRRKPVHAALLGTLLLSLPTFGLVGTRTIQNRIAARHAQIDSLLVEARWLEERRRYGEAQGKAAAVLEMVPKHALGLRYRAMARFQSAQQMKDPSTSAALAEQALGDISQLIALRPNESWPHGLKALMLRELKRTDEAEAEEALAEQFRSETPSDEELSHDARLAMSGNRYERAIELFSELILRSPDRVSAISSRALALERVDDPDAAFNDYRVAIGLDPDDDLTFVDLARMSTDRGALEDGTRYVERALELNPQSGFAHETLAYNLIKRGITSGHNGDVELARELFEQSADASRRGLELERNLLWADINLGNSLIERNRLLEESSPELVGRAIEHYEKALEMWPSPPTKGQEHNVYVAALANGCDAQIQLESFEEALAVCSRMTVAAPDNAVGFYNLAGVYALLGREEEALAALDRDRELGDHDWEYLETDRWFESLRGDSRFQRILAEMKGSAG